MSRKRQANKHFPQSRKEVISMVRVPSTVDIAAAIRLYYEKSEISNADIIAIFGKMGSAKVAALKKLALEKMAENGVRLWDSRCVNTDSAYTAWGLSIADLEKRYSRLQKIFGEKQS